MRGRNVSGAHAWPDVLAMALSFMLTSPFVPSASAQEFYDVQLDSVYAGTTYVLSDLTSVPVDDFEELDGVDSKIFWDGDVAKIKVSGLDEEETLQLVYVSGEDTYHSNLPVYDYDLAPKSRKLKNPARIVLTNRYADPVIVKCKGYNRPGWRREFIVTLPPYGSVTKRVHYEELRCGDWIQFRGQSIPHKGWTVLGFKV